MRAETERGEACGRELSVPTRACLSRDRMVSCGLVGKQEEDVHERAGASELDAAQGAGLLINLLSPTAGSGVGVRCPAPGYVVCLGSRLAGGRSDTAPGIALVFRGS
ncbi:unnamed protein product [Boreogadus saida]